MMLHPKDLQTLKDLVKWWRINKTRVLPKAKAKAPSQMLSTGSRIKIGIADETITAGSTGTISIWQKNATTGALEDTTNDETAYLDWMTAEDISEGKQVAIAWQTAENIWRILWAECEDATPPDVLSGSTTLKAQTLTNDFAEVGGMIETYKSGSAIIAAIAE